MNMKLCLRSSLLFGVAAIAMTGSAFAQETAETVVITGSRIPVSANFAAPTAVTTISQDVLQMTGTVNVADMLRTVPSFGVSGISSSNSNFQTAGAGINTLELRNLGEDRTLVLVDGKRYVSGVAGSGSVDFNTIPTDMIDRVEVITGGASAIYGSDALAGVINVVLKEDFEGLTANVQSGRTGYNDDVQYKVSAMFGGNFANDKGNAVISAAWSRNEGVLAKDRPDTRVDDIAGCFVANLDCNTPYYNYFSSYSAYGRFAIPSTGAAYTVSSGTGAAGTVVPFATTTYGFNRNAYRVLETPVDRLVLAANAHYNFTDSLQFYLQTQFANTKSDSNIEPDPTDDTYLGANDYAGDLLGVPLDNPYMPAAIRNAAIAAGDNYVDYRRRMVELGPRQYSANRDLYRVVAGLKGTIDDKFHWDVYFDWGHTLDTQYGSGQVNVLNMREALQAHAATAADVAGGATTGGAPAAIGDIICNNVYAQGQGCAPINLFGLGSITKAAANYVAAPQTRVDNIDEQVIGGQIVGPVYTLPAGDISLVGGFEYRREQASDIPDSLTQQGLTDGNKAPETIGGYHVLDLFAETEVPILKDETLIKELSVGGAWRWSQYGSGLVTNAYTGRVSWSPIDDLRFRGQFSHAVRAPNINELFAPGGQDFGTVSDPCNGITATGNGSTSAAIAAQCRTNPGIAARIASTGSFTLQQTEIQGTGGTSGAGNLALTPEKSDTWSVGGVYSHDFGDLGAVTFTVDWFHINIGNVISAVGRQDVLTLCYNGTPNAFCNMLVRKSTGPAFQLGAITQVNSGYGNQGFEKTSGIDFALTYQVDLNDFNVLNHGSAIGLDDAGQVSVRTNWTWTQALTTQSFGLLTYFNNTVEDPMHKVQLAIIYTNGPVSLQWETDFQSSTVDSRDPNSSFYGLPQRAYFLSNLSAAYDLTKNLQLYGGINNIMDTPAPNVLSGVPGNTTGSNTDESAYDAIGRRFFIGARVKY